MDGNNRWSKKKKFTKFNGYKEGSKIPIIEESAKLKIAEYLANKNKKVIIKDINDIIIEVKKEYGNLFSYEII